MAYKTIVVRKFLLKILVVAVASLLYHGIEAQESSSVAQKSPPGISSCRLFDSVPGHFLSSDFSSRYKPSITSKSHRDLSTLSLLCQF